MTLWYNVVDMSRADDLAREQFNIKRPSDTSTGVPATWGQVLFFRLFVRLSTFFWRACVDWRTRRPMLMRVTAHLSLILLALSVPIIGRIRPAAPAMSSPAFDATTPQPPVPTAEGLTGGSAWHPDPLPLLSRQALPETFIPDRPRAVIEQYTIQPGDNLYSIADAFGISVWTLVWANRVTLMDAPWLIQPGITLVIPPVNGVYHLVQEGDTVESIAAQYEVEPAALYNEWNDLADNQRLLAGQQLMVVGGQGEDIELTPPPPPPRYATAGAAAYSSGICNGVSFSGPGANGWFILPTGSTRVSGWYFGDGRNPGHIGLDYGCHLGDPLYAADNGVVTIAGWNGGYGILIEINHGNGFVTRYGHLSDLVVGCGQSVYQGQLIGYCGSTGWSTGPHLHYEIRYGGVPQDPLRYQQ